MTILSEKGVPTPVVHTKLPRPRSRMDPADDVDGAAKASPLYAKYGTRVDAESAREVLAARMEASTAAAAQAEADEAPKKQADEAAKQAAKTRRSRPAGGRRRRRLPQLPRGQAIQKEVVRGVFGMLKKAMR